MQTERRSYPRFKLQDLKASITFEDAGCKQQVTEGAVLDISYTGIKLKLDTPMSPRMNSTIRIVLTLPETGIPLNISGLIKHQTSAVELGLHYIDSPRQDVFNDLIFECFKR